MSITVNNVTYTFKECTNKQEMINIDSVNQLLYAAYVYLDNKHIGYIGINKVSEKIPGYYTKYYIKPDYDNKTVHKACKRYLLKIYDDKYYYNRLYELYTNKPKKHEYITIDFNNNTLYARVISRPTFMFVDFFYRMKYNTENYKKYLNKIHYRIDKNTYDLVYKRFKSYIKLTTIPEYLRSKGFREIFFEDIELKKFSGLYIDYIHNYHNTYSFRLYKFEHIKKIPTKLYNHFLKSRINKRELYDYFNTMGKQYICNYWDIETLDRLPYDGVFIAKPTDGSLGVGISILTSDDDLSKYKENVNNVRNNKKNKETTGVPLYDKLANYALKKEIYLYEYFDNPILYNNKKIDFRLFFMLKYINGKLSYSYFKHLRLLIAREDYKKGDYFNKNIHNPNIDVLTTNVIFPDDFNLGSKINNKIKSQLKEISSILFDIFDKRGVTPFKASENAYQIYGIDMLVLSDYTIKIMEINSAPELIIGNNTHKNIMKYDEEFCNWIKQNVLDPVFGLNVFDHASSSK